VHKPNRNFQKAMTAAYTLLGSIILSGSVGYYLFNKYNNIMWLVGLLLMGIIVGMYELYKQLK